MKDTVKMSAKQIQNRLEQNIGTSRYYGHSSRVFVYTDGIKEMAELCQAWWLLDIVHSVQTLDIVKKEPFQVFDIKKNGSRAVVRVTDGNNNLLYRQKIPFTDFPLEQINLFYQNRNAIMEGKKYHRGVLYLPSEH